LWKIKFQRYGLLRLPGQVLSTEPVLTSPCLAFAAYASQMAVLHLSFA
jgi:hypothetical protein